MLQHDFRNLHIFTGFINIVKFTYFKIVNHIQL